MACPRGFRWWLVALVGLCCTLGFCASEPLSNSTAGTCGCHSTWLKAQAEHSHSQEAAWKLQKLKRDHRECTRALHEMTQAQVPEGETDEERGKWRRSHVWWIADLSPEQVAAKCDGLKEAVGGLERQLARHIESTREHEARYEEEDGKANEPEYARQHAHRAHQIEHPLSAIPAQLYHHQFNVTFLMQYFKHPENVETMVRRLYQCSHGAAGDGQFGWRSELIVNVDSHDPADVEAWVQALGLYKAFVNLVLSPNLHEVHGYNRVSSMARGEVLVLLQDDDPLSDDCSWADRILRTFHAKPKVGMVGVNNAVMWPGMRVHGRAPRKGGGLLRIPGGPVPSGVMFTDEHLSIPMQYVMKVDFGPVAVRESAFRHVGRLDEAMALPGECGIYTDYELSMRMWASGYHVLHMTTPPELKGLSDQGGSHQGGNDNDFKFERCWEKQSFLNGFVYDERYKPQQQHRVFEEVKRLNSEELKPLNNDMQRPWKDWEASLPENYWEGEHVR